MHRGMAMLAGLLLFPWIAAAQGAGDIVVGPATALGGDGVRVQRQALRLYGIAGRPLTCSIVSLDPGEPEAICKVGGVQGSDIAAIMVDAGWASAEQSRSLRRIRPELIKLYVRLEVEARAACLGLWRTQPICGRESRQ